MITFYRIHPSPIIALNRIIPLGKVEGEERALLALSKLENDKGLANNYLLPATKAELYIKLKKPEEARRYLKAAVELTDNQKEKAFLRQKMELL